MTDPTFTADLEALTADLTDARATLVSTVQRLSDADLDRARRGGWPVRRVLEHLIQSEWLYATLVTHLRRDTPPERPQLSCEGQPVDEILCMLDAGRNALLQSIDGVDEGAFYDVQRMGHEEYSVLSVLENAANHDREHAEQITAILSAA
jgi:uncharacterized damage-inducible protein DinB